MRKLLWSVMAVVIAVAVGCSSTSSRERETSDASGTATRATGTMEDWISAVCMIGPNPEIPARPMTCRGYSEGGGFSTLFSIPQFGSIAEMRAHPEMWRGRYGYALCASADGSVVLFVSDVSGIGDNQDALQLTKRAMQPLADFGCVITESNPYQSPPVTQRGPHVPPSPTQSPRRIPPATAPAPGREVDVSVSGTDAQGFTDSRGPRCNHTNPAVAIARTELSRVVICETGVGRLYYKGLGLDSGLPIEIDDPAPTPSGFVVTNEGVRYTMSRSALLITRGSEVISNERMVEYWSK